MPQKKWSQVAPKSTAEREALYRRCGSKCFLEPGRLKYPVCEKSSRTCKATQQGINAAKSRRRLVNAKRKRSPRK